MTPPKTTKDTTEGAAGPSKNATGAAANRRRGVSADDVQKRLDDIEEYLTGLAKALEEYQWGSNPLKLKGHGGTGTGSTPPKWPP
jgi:hypothetical protein